MKTQLHWLLLASLTFGFGCQSTDNTTLGQPRIQSVSFTGIPTQNVQFDPAYHKIVVTLPAVLPDGLKPVFELTPDTQIVEGLATDNTIDLTPFCTCHSTSLLTIGHLRIANQKTSITYDLYVVASGPLKAQITTEQFTISRNSNSFILYLPVENLYTNPSVSQLKFTNLATGKVAVMEADGGCLNSCLPAVHDRLVFSLKFTYSLSNYFPTPGIYSIAVDDLSFPQKLVVTD